MTYRTDIDGLRALAVLAVVLYHVEAPGFGWGFAGVDVFFVVSGYLISTLLWLDVENHGRPRLVRFYSRRVRRLLPLATLVVVTTALVSAMVLSPIRLQRLAAAAGSTVVYSSNLLFGWFADDYFRADLVRSPLLHTWSLAVEEQFYLVWPLLFVVATGRAGTRRRLLGVLATTALASLALCLLWTARGSAWAFYAMPSRAWQFAAGGLLALGTLRRPVVSARAVVALGLVLAGSTAVVLHHSAPYPGWRALLPTGATLALLYGAPGVPAVDRVLSSGPARWLGARSYGWYLWHWPPLVLLADTQHHVPLPVKALVALGSLVLADLTYRWVEDPIRRAPQLTERPLRNAALGGGLALVTGLVASLLSAVHARTLDDPGITRWTTQVGDPVPANCNPLRDQAGCSMGPRDAQRTVLVVGDSHAAHWAPALAELPEALGVRVVFGTTNCLLLDLPLADPGWERRCQGRRRAIRSYLEQQPVDLVLLSVFHGYRQLDTLRATDDRALRDWSAATERFATDLSERGIPLGVLQDVHYPTLRAVDCLTATSTPATCDTPRALTRELDRIHTAQRDGLQRAGHGAVWDPAEGLCDTTACRVSVDGRLVFRDRDHLTAGYAKDRAPELIRFTAGLLDR